jgi:hypothetical protein
MDMVIWEVFWIAEEDPSFSFFLGIGTMTVRLIDVVYYRLDIYYVMHRLILVFAFFLRE